MKKLYTVVGLCRCGCDDGFVEHTEASTADRAAKKVLKERDRSGDVVGVFEGHLYSKMSVGRMTEIEEVLK